MSREVFKKFLNENNLKIQIIDSKEKTHTAQQAAYVHNVSVKNIVKSILVKTNNEFTLFLVPGDKKIDLKIKGARIAKPQEVENITGYPVGGVPPFGHKKKIKTYIEEGFDENETLLAAAGSPNSVFKISLGKMRAIIGNI